MLVVVCWSWCVGRGGVLSTEGSGLPSKSTQHCSFSLVLKKCPRCFFCLLFDNIMYLIYVSIHIRFLLVHPYGIAAVAEMCFHRYI